MKSIELDALRHCIAQTSADYNSLRSAQMLKSPTSPNTYSLISPITPVRRVPRARPLTLPPELIAYILTLAHAEDILYLLHLCPGGSDPTTRRFISSLGAVASMPDVRRMVFSNAIARVGLHAPSRAELARTLDGVDGGDAGGPLKLSVLFGVRDERRPLEELQSKSALPVLLEHARRWREIRIEGWNHEADIAFLAACAPALPFVRHLQLIVNSSPVVYDEEDNVCIESIFSGSSSEGSADEAMDIDGKCRVETNFESANISAQYIPGFARSGAFDHIRTLRIQTAARRGAGSLATFLAPLARLRKLETLEIVEVHDFALGSGAGFGFATGAPVSIFETFGGSLHDLEESMSSAGSEGSTIPANRRTATSPLCIPSLRRVCVKGATATGVLALARYLQASTGIEAFDVADIQKGRAGDRAVQEKAQVLSTLLPTIHSTFPALSSLTFDADLSGALSQLAMKVDIEAESGCGTGAQWLFPRLRTLGLRKAVSQRELLNTLRARSLAASVGVSQLARLSICLPSPPSSSSLGRGGNKLVDNAMNSVEETRFLCELENFVPNVERVFVSFSLYSGFGIVLCLMVLC